MSKKFKKTLEEKYGKSGKKGSEGEEFFRRFYEAKGYIVIHNDDDVVLQSRGIDFCIDTGKGLYSVDVKNNLTEYNTIYVECLPDGWLFNPKKKSEFISHVNPLSQVIVTYRRIKMQMYLQEHFWDYRNDIISFPLSELTFAKVEGTVI